MYTSEELLQEINKIRESLLNMPYDLQCLSNQELVVKSQELDRLISMYQSMFCN
ncbi:Spo0E family sporulation regulatory protein-aspartic acid phosphatase [Fictibacillus phosphorivorans]|uniref:Spo0E family sporulation regulatory protein-aspartic acid phosphatase n=1 Tax=Fictibacillus phosphorivorans TaxID=1221500 RepID=UPI003CF14FF9